jgi:hypothetical protein
MCPTTMGSTPTFVCKSRKRTRPEKVECVLFYSAVVDRRALRCKRAKATRQMVTDKREPTAVASPIGNRVPGKRSEVKYTPGTRTSEMDKILR